MLGSQLYIVEQAKQFLSEISVSDYSTPQMPHFSSSAGAHMRHVLDHYLAIKLAADSGLVDYNKRNRFSEVESDPKAASAQWQDIETWLIEVSEKINDHKVEVVSEICAVDQLSIQVPSTLARELVFVLGHAVHHFSLLAVIRSLQGKSCPENFGLAPSTISYLRQQA